MPYPPHIVDPMRAELTVLGVDELRTADQVDAAMADAAKGTLLVVINSVCGCAAGNARPAVRLAVQTPVQPDRYVTVFAGQDLEATAQMRAYLPGIPPSSPFIALMQDGDPVFVLERRHIEGRTAGAIASDLAAAFSRFCGQNEPEWTEDAATPQPAEQDGHSLPPTFRSIL